jgi:hypothetical protein
MVASSSESMERRSSRFPAAAEVESSQPFTMRSWGTRLSTARWCSSSKGRMSSSSSMSWPSTISNSPELARAWLKGCSIRAGMARSRLASRGRSRLALPPWENSPRGSGSLRPPRISGRCLGSSGEPPRALASSSRSARPAMAARRAMARSTMVCPKMSLSSREMVCESMDTPARRDQVLDLVPHLGGGLVALPRRSLERLHHDRIDDGREARHHLAGRLDLLLADGLDHLHRRGALEELRRSGPPTARSRCRRCRERRSTFLPRACSGDM